MRSCTDFWAPEPRAIMVITAPTPMMIPSMVRSERSLLARSASSATRMISPNSIGLPRRGALLLADPGQPAAGHVLEALAELLQRLHQRGARQHQHRVPIREPACDLDVVLIGEARANRHGRDLAAAQREHDVASSATPSSARIASLAARRVPPVGSSLELTAQLREQGLLRRREVAAGHALSERGAHLLRRHARREGDGPPTRRCKSRAR